MLTDMVTFFMSCPICLKSLGKCCMPRDQMQFYVQDKCSDCKRATWIVDEIQRRLGGRP